jgi:malonyl CoA-acyl carrier protein transacylase
MTTYVFPGQGSQTIGMGKDLFNRFPEFTSQANDILGYSITELCLEDSKQQLNLTQFTQPALFIVNVLSFFQKLHDTGKIPNYVLGHSLGEYNALFAAGVFDFATGIKLVQKRGELMSHAKEGAMAAVIGLNAEKIQAVLTENNLNDVYVANYNSVTQIVISGAKKSIDAAIPIFEKSDARMIIPLKVSGAFHSPLMEEAKNEFVLFLNEFSFSPPKIPVIANLSATPYQIDSLNITLANQITHPVKWTESIQYLLSQQESEFEEIGPGTVLTGLITKIKNGQ